MTTINQPGVTLTCTNPDCTCQLQIMVPCPHGDTHTCACGHSMQTVSATPPGSEAGDQAVS